MADFADMVIVDDGEDSGGLFGAVKSATEEVAASQGVDEGGASIPERVGARTHIANPGALGRGPVPQRTHAAAVCC